MGKYYGYARISSVGQSKWSIDEQRSFLEARAEKLGLEFLFYPEEKSGLTLDREVLAELKGLLQPGDILGVAYSDRLGRGGAEDIVELGKLNERGITVELRGIPYDSSNPEATFGNDVVMIAAKAYSMILGKKAKDGIRRARESGHFLFKSNIYGYRRSVIAGKVVIESDPLESKIIQNLFQLHKTGLSYPKISERLAEMGFLSRRGKPFPQAELRKMLMNPVYMGYYHPTPPKLKCGAIDRSNVKPEELVKSHYYPALVDPSDWWVSFHGRRLMVSKYPSRRGYQTRPYELTGLIKCRYCLQHERNVALIRGYKQIVTPTGVNHYPIYTTRLHLKGCPTIPKGYKAEILENLFRCLLVLTFERPTEIRSFIFDEIKKNMKSEKEVIDQTKLLKRQLEEKINQRRRIVQAIRMSDTDIEELVEDRETLNGAIHQIEKSIEQVQSPHSLGKIELEERMRGFSVERLKAFFDPKTTGQVRRKLYISLIEKAIQETDRLVVRFHNTKTYTIKVEQAKGKNYQKQFLVDVEFRSESQGAVLVETTGDLNGFSAYEVREDGRSGDKYPFVEQVKAGQFDQIDKDWQLAMATSEPRAPISAEYVKTWKKYWKPDVQGRMAGPPSPSKTDTES